ncbi:hypothetical protein ACWTU6_26530 [Mesorhizobium sp. BHbsci]
MGGMASHKGWLGWRHAFADVVPPPTHGFAGNQRERLSRNRYQGFQSRNAGAILNHSINEVSGSRHGSLAQGNAKLTSSNRLP